MSYNTVGIIKNGVKQKLPVVMVAPKVDGPDYVEVVADGVKTWSQLLDSLYALADITKITNYSLVEDSDGVLFGMTFNSTSWVRFACASYSGQGATVTELIIQSSGSLRRYARGTTVVDESSTVVTSGHKLTLYYDTATLDLTTRASNCVYDNSNSDLSATDAQGAIDEIMSGVTLKVAVLSTTITPNIQDVDTIGYRTSETSKVVIADLPGYPAGKNIVGMIPVCKQSSVAYRNAILNIDNINCLRACSVISETFDVRIYVFYTEV